MTSEDESGQMTTSFVGLRTVLKDLEKIDRKTDRILALLQASSGFEGEEVGSGAGAPVTLLSLPDHLRRTLSVARQVGSVTSLDVAKQTGRAKALESSYLNQLARAGFLRKRRRGRKVFFTSAQ